ncbi:hypothetical protein LINPERPRIM_LOCUS35549 [Linum perenne]
MSSTSNIGCAVVAVDGSEESMYALRWALDNVNLRSPPANSSELPGSFVVLHVQSPPSIAVGLNPGAIPFGGPSDLEVPAFTAAIEAHQKRITEAIFDHALDICRKQNLVIILPFSFLLICCLLFLIGTELLPGCCANASGDWGPQREDM